MLLPETMEFTLDAQIADPILPTCVHAGGNERGQEESRAEVARQQERFALFCFLLLVYLDLGVLTFTPACAERVFTLLRSCADYVPTRNVRPTVRGKQ